MTDQSQTLYRKWRSQTFNELVGQDAVVHTLQQAVAQDRLTHAYLFCGPRGTGKTSAARLLAKMINCQNPQAGEPCNDCLSCREITEGRSTDVFEIDAASNRGIDDIRDLRERVRVMSGTGRTRLYIIDEVHMLTNEAFNALLKTLEEPPPHVIFVLATTEAHKLPPTVVSRCQQFEFRRITLRIITARLRFVCEQEGMRADPAALELLGRAAAGGMRDALSLLDQARAFSGDDISIAAVRGMLGMADPALVREVITFVAAADTAAGLHRINDLAQSGVDLRQLTSQIAEIWRQLMLARAGADIAALLDLTPETAADLQALSAQFALEDLTECARIFARNDAGARVQVVPQLQLELAFLDSVHAVHHHRPPTVATLPESGPRPAPVTHYATAPAPMPPITNASNGYAAASSNGQHLAEPEPAPSRAPTPPPAPVPVIRETPESAPAAPPPSMPRGGLPPALSEALSTLQNQWEMVKKVSKQSSHKVAALLASSRPVSLEPGVPPTIIIAVGAQFHQNKLSLPEYRQNVEWAILQVAEITCEARFVLEAEARNYGPVAPVAESAAPTSRPPVTASPTSVPTPTPSAPTPPPPPVVATPPASQAAKPSDPRALAENDAVVQALQREFGTKVVDVKPLAP